MKYYCFDNASKAELFNCALFDIDQGNEIKVIAAPNMTMRTANKVCAFGQEVVVSGNTWSDEVETTIHSLLTNSAEAVIIEIVVDHDTIFDICEIILRIESSLNLFGAKIRLIENIIDSVNLSDQKWNELIVKCYDHKMDMSWTGNAAVRHYETYLKDINE